MVGLKGGWASLGFSASNFVSKSIFCYRTQAKLLNEDERTRASVPDDQSSLNLYHLKYPEDS